MKFVSLRDFRTKTAQIRKDLKVQHEIVLTANGRPTALLVDVNEDDFEETVKAARWSRLSLALDRIQADAKKRGLDKLTMTQIDAIIGESRRERRRRDRERGA